MLRMSSWMWSSVIVLFCLWFCVLCVCPRCPNPIGRATCWLPMPWPVWNWNRCDGWTAWLGLLKAKFSQKRLSWGCVQMANATLSFSFVSRLESLRAWSASWVPCCFQRNCKRHQSLRTRTSQDSLSASRFNSAETSNVHALNVGIKSSWALFSWLPFRASARASFGTVSQHKSLFYVCKRRVRIA